jgi:hypothetical protein
MIQQIENFLPLALEQEIRNALLSDNFPWFFNNSTTPENKECLTAFQFTHSFFTIDRGWNSSWSSLIQRMLDVAQLKIKIDPTKLIRAKANLVPLFNHVRDSSLIHKDVQESGFKSLLYYVDNSDGDTIIFDEDKIFTQKITPKRNTAIFFDSNIWHSPSPPTQHKRRVIINMIIEN